MCLGDNSGSVVMDSLYNSGDTGLIPGWGMPLSN